MKHILVIYYTQSGQLRNILDSFLKPLSQKNEDYSITYEELKPNPAYPFPWSYLSFVDVQPESVLEIPTELSPLQFDSSKKYDLIVFGYQPWFLSPSIPATSFFSTPQAARVLKDTPVITINGCRNMWLHAQESIKNQLNKHNAKLILNIPLSDNSPNSVSAITIVFWLLTGKKQYFKFLPEAGVSREDIEDLSRFGIVIENHLSQGSLEKRTNLSAEYPAPVEQRLIFIENTGKRIFKIWARVIRRFGGPGSVRRKPVVLIFSIYLIVVMTIFFPINKLSFLLQKIFNKRKLQTATTYYSKNIGSGI